MKLSAKTIEILKNFSTINQGICIDKGNRITTISTARQVVGLATVEDTFPQKFAIYDLPMFLSVLSMLGETEFEFNDRYVLLKNDKGQTITYYFSNPEYIKTPKSDKLPPYSDVSAKFTLTREMLDTIKKTSAVMRLDNIEVSKDGLRLYDPSGKNAASNESKLAIEITADENKHHLRIDLLKMIPATYEVEIVKDMMAVFKNVDVELDYVVSLERVTE